MKKLYSITFSFLLLFLTGTAFADNNAYSSLSHQDIESELNTMGITYKLNNNEVDIFINKTKTVESIPLMQSFGMMNPDISQTEINIHSTMYACLVGLNFTTVIIPDIYKNNDKDELSFKAYLIVADDYGNNKKHLIYSFNFNKNLYSKINWSNFSPDKLIKISPNFKFTEWYNYNL